MDMTKRLAIIALMLSILSLATIETTTIDNKVNKSGDIMNGDLQLSSYNQEPNIDSSYKIKLLNVSFRSWEYLSSGYNATLVDFAFLDGEYTQRQFDKWFQVTNNYNNSGLFFTFKTNNSKFIALDFQVSDGLFWRFGMDNTDDFKIKKYGGNGDVIFDSTNIIVTNLAGSGNAFACLDSTGKLYRSSIACN